MNPPSFYAVLFDLDGVLTPTAALHARCWMQTLDLFLDDWGRSTGTRPEPFDAERDYLAHVDGKLRDDGALSRPAPSSRRARISTSCRAPPEPQKPGRFARG